jgi:hypothetical protein
MADLTDALVVRAAVDDDWTRPEYGEGVQVVRRSDGELNHVRIRFDTPLDIDSLTEHFGAVQNLPSLPSGGRRAAFPDTGPHAGQRTTTVLAELDDADRVIALVFRADDARHIDAAG